MKKTYFGIQIGSEPVQSSDDITVTTNSRKVDGCLSCNRDVQTC